MRPASGRPWFQPWTRTAALLCLLACAPLQAAHPQATRDHALIAHTVAAMPAATGDAPALYVVGVAGDAGEDVFRNEVRFLRERVAPRLGAGARTLALVNHADSLTGAGTPLATPTNLRHALAALGAHMDRERDVLLLYLTMHGSPDHALGLVLPDGREDTITPDALRAALDDAGIVHRVVVISACYSGGFIPALQTPDTLVLTAARADRPSFGCGSDSTITFFGHAWLLDGLNADPDFVNAYRLAARAIKQRERKLGYERSNPQIAAGARIGETLSRWRATLPAAPVAAVYPYPITP
ncbi:Peptidase C13 [Luteimonas sp. 9C]|uniref:C13 family peptidase n=1 Tax=Luteimonas sp. 9C TaxID=2653148 RepID=UPI0012F272C7|nr:C13 family peptidase [Luteimonas sp. 9C]VXB35074.1 Peptidase C13 [Luteimonas sp. 9C]